MKQSMMTLKRIEKSQFKILVQWNEMHDADYLLQWAGSKYQFPIAEEQIEKRAELTDVQIYAAFMEEKMIGSVELDVDSQNKAAFICRLLIDDNEQSKGYGTSILNKLIEMAYHDMGLEKLQLHVFCFNVGAIRCYEKCGFRVKAYEQCNESRWCYYTMELKNAVV